MSTTQPVNRPIAPRGVFVVIEGIDHSGKTTQCSALAARLVKEQKRPVLSIHFPDRTTPTGKLIARHLAGEATIHDPKRLYNLFVDNRREKSDDIRTALAQGTTVICDRWSYSGIAYASAKGVLDPFWCAQQEAGLPAPDVVVLLDLEPGPAQTRGGKREIYDDVAMQANARHGFQECFPASLANQKLEPRPAVLRRLDAANDKEDLHDAIYASWCFADSLIRRSGIPLSTFRTPPPWVDATYWKWEKRAAWVTLLLLSFWFSLMAVTGVWVLIGFTDHPDIVAIPIGAAIARFVAIVVAGQPAPVGWQNTVLTLAKDTLDLLMLICGVKYAGALPTIALNVAIPEWLF